MQNFWCTLLFLFFVNLIIFQFYFNTGTFVCNLFVLWVVGNNSNDTRDDKTRRNVRILYFCCK